MNRGAADALVITNPCHPERSVCFRWRKQMRSRRIPAKQLRLQSRQGILTSTIFFSAVIVDFIDLEIFRVFDEQLERSCSVFSGL